MQQAQALLLTTFVLAKGNFAEAETRFRAGLEMSPSDGSLHYYLGISLHSLNQLQGAEASYITALENLVGDAHKTHRAASRGSLCQILSQVSIPSHSSAHSAPYGRKPLQQGDALRPRALEVCRSSVALDPENAETCNILGTIYGSM